MKLQECWESRHQSNGRKWLKIEEIFTLPHGITNNGSDAVTDLTELAEDAMNDATSNVNGNTGRHGKLDWKTEYLVYCLYAKCNMLLRRTAALFGVSGVLVHNIVHAWAKFLCITLQHSSPFQQEARCFVHIQRVSSKSLGMQIFSCC